MRRFGVFALVSLTLALAAMPAAAQTPVVSSRGTQAGPYGPPTAQGQDYQIVGELQLWGTDGKEFTCDQFECDGAGEYAFLFRGEVVSVLDPSGARISFAYLTQIPAPSAGEVSFEFELIVNDQPSYTVQFKDGPAFNVTKPQFEAAGWGFVHAFGRVPNGPSATPLGSPAATPAASPAATPASPSAAAMVTTTGLDLGPVPNSDMTEIAAFVILRGAEGEQFHCVRPFFMCQGLVKYQDIGEGAAVVAADASGKQVGSAGMTLIKADSTDQRLVFRALLLVPRSDSYTFDFANHRGFPATRAALETNGWVILLILGPAPGA